MTAAVSRIPERVSGKVPKWIEPQGARLLVVRDAPREKMGQVFLSEAGKRPPLSGTVIAAGPDVKAFDADAVEMRDRIKVGARVLFGPYAVATEAVTVLMLLSALAVVGRRGPGGAG